MKSRSRSATVKRQYELTLMLLHRSLRKSVRVQDLDTAIKLGDLLRDQAASFATLLANLPAHELAPPPSPNELHAEAEEKQRRLREMLYPPGFEPYNAVEDKAEPAPDTEEMQDEVEPAAAPAPTPESAPELIPAANSEAETSAPLAPSESPQPPTIIAPDGARLRPTSQPGVYKVLGKSRKSPPRPRFTIEYF